MKSAPLLLSFLNTLQRYPFPSSDLKMNQQHVFDIVQEQTSGIQETWPTTTILPCLGNHEVFEWNNKN